MRFLFLLLLKEMSWVLAVVDLLLKIEIIIIIVPHEVNMQCKVAAKCLSGAELKG